MLVGILPARVTAIIELPLLSLLYHGNVQSPHDVSPISSSKFANLKLPILLRIRIQGRTYGWCFGTASFTIAQH